MELSPSAGAVFPALTPEVRPLDRVWRSPTLGRPVPTTGWAPETPLRAPRPVSLGLTSSDETIATRYQFWGTHDGVKLLASQVALE